MERRSVELPAGTVHYRAAGPVDGPPVVFVHGFLVDDTLWSDVPGRLGDRGFRAYAPTWPLGSHRTAMAPGADLSPRGVAGVVASFLEAMDLDDVVVIGNDTGGAVSQLLLDVDPSRVGRLVLTNCDAFECFPPAPFGALFRLARHPVAAKLVFEAMRPAFLRHSRLGFGGLVRGDLPADDTLGWVLPYLTDHGVRRDVASFARAWRGDELVDSTRWLGAFEKPVLLAWAPEDPFFTYDLGKRLLATFPDATLVELRGAGAFVALDQPARLAEEIVKWVGVGATP